MMIWIRQHRILIRNRQHHRVKQIHPKSLNHHLFTPTMVRSKCHGPELTVLLHNQNKNISLRNEQGQRLAWLKHQLKRLNRHSRHPMHHWTCTKRRIRTWMMIGFSFWGILACHWVSPRKSICIGIFDQFSEHFREPLESSNILVDSMSHDLFIKYQFRSLKF